MKIIKRILSVITIVCVSQVLFLSFASNKLVIDKNSAKNIPMNGSCKLVTNNCSYPIFVPLYPSGATKSFFVNPPSCAVVDVCDTTAPTTTDDANDTWRKTDFLVTLISDQPGETKYCVDTNGTCIPDTVGKTVNVTCPLNTTCPSQYVRYYSTDVFGNIEPIKTSAKIRIDKQAPTFTFSNTSGPECTAGSLSITSASDIGAGLHTSPYSSNGTTWTATASISTTAQQPGTQTKTAYVRDSLGNFSSRSATYTFTNVAPTANNFVGHSSVGNTAKTVNWKILSSATEGSCGNTSIVYNSIVSQGTKGTCSVTLDAITYTPNANQAGSDTCTVQVKDNENSTVNFVVTWNGIDTAAPIGGSLSINGGVSYTKSTAVTLNITCPTDAWTPIQVAYGNTASPTNWTTCTSSIAHTLTSTNGTRTVYARFRDGGGNTTANINDTIILDTTAPTYTSYTNITGHLYVNGSDYWFKPGSELSIDITHSDNIRVYRQYFGFNSGGCSPNGCGLAPNEIKSYNTDNSFTDRGGFTYDTHIDIYSSDCVDSDGNCKDTDLTRRRKSSIKTTIPENDYKLNVYLYDGAMNGVGYSTLPIWIKIDGSKPITSITGPTAGSRYKTDFNVSFSDTDTRSGLGICKYRILNNGTQSLGRTNRTCNGSVTIDISNYCTTQGSNTCTIESHSIDNVGSTSTTQSRSFSIDTTAPTVSLSSTVGTYFSGTSFTVSATFSEATSNFVSSDISVTNGTISSFTAMSSTLYRWVVTPSGQGTVSISVAAGKATDAAGNNNTASNTISTIYDTTVPTGTISINGGATSTTNALVSLTLSASDTNGLSQMQFSCNGTNRTTAETYATTKSNFNITNQLNAGCTTAVGTKTVYVKYKDNVGNRSTAKSDTISYSLPGCTSSIDCNIGQICVGYIPPTRSYCDGSYATMTNECYIKSTVFECRKNGMQVVGPTMYDCEMIGGTYGFYYNSVFQSAEIKCEFNEWDMYTPLNCIPCNGTTSSTTCLNYKTSTLGGTQICDWKTAGGTASCSTFNNNQSTCQSTIGCDWHPGTSAVFGTCTTQTCGTANGQTYSTLTSTSPNLCNIGSATNFTTLTSSWTWNCGTASCSANKAASCTTPRGTTISDGSSVRAYRFSSVPCGGTCTSEIRVCDNGVLGGTYTNQSCIVQSCSSCGNGICEVGETSLSCPADCAVLTCFIGGTQVRMEDGSYKDIEDIKIGEKVIGQNNQINTVIGYDRPNLGNRKLYSINNGPYFVTHEHPFMTLEGWKSINPEATRQEMPDFGILPLKVGDVLVKENGKFELIWSITSKNADPKTPLYNFKLDGNNTYYANGYLVHNKTYCGDGAKCPIGYVCDGTYCVPKLIELEK